MNGCVAAARAVQPDKAAVRLARARARILPLKHRLERQVARRVLRRWERQYLAPQCLVLQCLALQCWALWAPGFELGPTRPGSCFRRL